MNKLGERLVKSLPSSFVFRNLKLAGDAGSGEAKLHLGSVKAEKEIDTYFNEFSKTNIYRFDKNNLLTYLHQVKIEYIYQKINRYSDVDLLYWQERFSEVSDLIDSQLQFRLLKFTDKSRYYIRSQEDIFKNTLRKIALPLITNIRINKYQDEQSFIYLFLLELNTDYGQNGRTEEREDEIESDIEDNKYLGENIIYYGAPGTGKSHSLNEKSKEFNFIERVTFYPEYTHDDFIGSFMPCMSYIKNDTTEYIAADGTSTILPGKPVPYYAYVPGPFTNALVDAFNNPNKNVLLIVEELNRANAAAVFGEFFQLLDRCEKDKKDGRMGGESEYRISVSNEYSEYLSSKIETYSKGEKVKIPNNFTICATMNSADQGVNPLDSAFKRRWNFKYVPIDFSDVEYKNCEIDYGKGKVTWETFATTINEQLKKKEINEDKHLGQYFITRTEIDDLYKFASKILLYLFEDVLKFNRRGFFKSDYKTFSDLLKGFINGEKIFEFEIKTVATNEASSEGNEVTFDTQSENKVSEGQEVRYGEQTENEGITRVAEGGSNEFQNKVL
ncbi:AAA family ATPase [Clostridium pasteurianum]|uniref:AAA family ATPase n=1 Tax=Clostridium pasteurianum TaxID=1501 RepID=UPI0022608416|nr:AAA family ATPase [Clostridium pasteurianum]UZW12597.1 AAA family ATPase [Clostridium pasteurianum]